MTEFVSITIPKGDIIAMGPEGVRAPDHPIIPFIAGDGIGPEVWEATRRVLDAAVKAAYGDARAVAWCEIFAGAKALEKYGEGALLPAETIAAIRRFRVVIKGPLTTPVGGGFRSVNVAMRLALDLYAGVRPVRHVPGTASPMKHPENVDLVIFRENTEDVYVGAEWPAHSTEAAEILACVNARLAEEKRDPLAMDSGVGIKPMSEKGSKRLIRAAFEYALKNGRPSVTLVHKGNIMKHTEGAFMRWGYELAREEYAGRVVTEAEAKGSAVIVKDRIADAMFQDLILSPENHSVLAAPNLNGDYLSDAAAALVGGLGLSPGANIGDEAAVFEAVHGAAPDIAGKDLANPASLILSGCNMLEYIGWDEAAHAASTGLNSAIAAGEMTGDLAKWVPGAKSLSCSAFAEAVRRRIKISD